MTFRKQLMTGAILLMSVFGSSLAHAIIPSGIGQIYSVAYGIDRALGLLPKDNHVWSLWFDPPPSSIERGRISVFYNTSLFQVEGYGWVGAFGQDSSIPAPQVTADGIVPFRAPNNLPWIFQSPNAALLSSNVSINSATGEIVVEFDFGLSAFTPPSNDNFIFFGIGFSVLEDNISDLAFVPRGTGDAGILGSEADVALNGINAASYLLCSSGFCGDQAKGDIKAVFSVPEPSTLILILLAIAMMLLAGLAAQHRRPTRHSHAIYRAAPESWRMPTALPGGRSEEIQT